MLGVAGVKYVGLGLVLLGYASVFRDVNAMFNSFADFIANNATGGTDIFSVWMADMRAHFNQTGYQGLLDLIAGGLVGLINTVFILVSYIIYPLNVHRLLFLLQFLRCRSLCRRPHRALAVAGLWRGYDRPVLHH
jgi:hypothetical protein